MSIVVFNQTVTIQLSVSDYEKLRNVLQSVGHPSYLYGDTAIDAMNLLDELPASQD